MGHPKKPGIYKIGYRITDFWDKEVIPFKWLIEFKGELNYFGLTKDLVDDKFKIG